MNGSEITGGNVSQVTTDGAIVYREVKPYSATVHRLLKHLENKGVDFCPRYLGIDKGGREKLSFVRGATIDDYPSCRELTDKIEVVRAAAILLKKYHSATLDYQPEAADQWFLEYTGDLAREVICHNDFAPYNVTFENDLPVGIIDFDTACPGPREWDIAYAVYRFVPLSRELYDPWEKTYRFYEKERDANERKTLLKEFLDSYGISTDIGKYIIARLQALVTLFDDECKKGNEAFLRMKQEGHQELYRKEIEFIKENIEDWIV
jgi:thiamine kinase-like enzyme